MNKKAQAKWLENTQDFPSEEIPLGYRLRSPLHSGEEPCPLSLAHGFYATQPSPSKNRRKWGKSLLCLNSSRRFWGMDDVTIED
jgi:hypothetical protein